jgi:predicted nucleotidyltransferase
MKKDLEQEILKVLSEIFSKDVDIFLFGSRASGKASIRSDYDIGLLRKDGQELDFKELLKAKSKLGDFIEKIDLVDFASKDDTFKEIAMQKIKYLKQSE